MDTVFRQVMRNPSSAYGSNLEFTTLPFRVFFQPSESSDVKNLNPSGSKHPDSQRFADLDTLSTIIYDYIVK